MRSLAMVPLLMLASCQPAAVGELAAANAFAKELAGRVAGPAQTCISDQPNQNLRTVDARTVAYDVGATVWVNRLQDACPALNPYNTLIVERSGGQICRGDRVRGLEPGATIPGPSCNLQDWVPYRRP